MIGLAEGVVVFVREGADCFEGFVGFTLFSFCPCISFAANLQSVSQLDAVAAILGHQVLKLPVAALLDGVPKSRNILSLSTLTDKTKVVCLTILQAIRKSCVMFEQVDGEAVDEFGHFVTG